VKRALLVLVLLAAAACGDDGGDGGTVRLLTHESFNVSDDVLAQFTEETGYEVEIVAGGDAGTVVNQAILTAGNPQGDVLYGIDTTFLSLGLDEGLFDPYESPLLSDVPDDLEIDAEHRVTPIDIGDVCLNYDREFFEAPGAPAVPTSLADLTDPAYRDLLVVQDPATSSPGLAFLAGTVEELGEPGWEAYWQGLRDNGVRVASDWTDAYYSQFSGGSGEGDRPLVVSYATSPPAEASGNESPTAAIDASCVRQVEYAGVLAGAENPEGAHALVDFLLSGPFQSDMPMNMFVLPVRDGTPLPAAFEQFAATPENPIVVDPFELGEVRDDLLARWRDIVIR
jgi:thiamine transport system substrate-binding protein